MVEALPSIIKVGAESAKMKTTWMCSLCHMEDPDDENWHCNAESGREYFQQHVDDTH